ncbi:MAG: alpha/beta fold hydrolase [Granulosicoccus sp.]
MKDLFIQLTIVSGLALTSACSSSDDELSNVRVDRNSELTWESCSNHSSLQCTNLDVHSNPADTQSETISLALNRLPSIQSESEGIILINPGGPGGSGIELLEELSSAGTLPQALRDKYDFIGFDPRGVGESSSVDCSEFGSTEINEYLTNDQAIDEFFENQTAVAMSCEQKYGGYLQRLGSQNVVHDMEAIRYASGADKIHYLGFSYGTRLGALYLQTYPENSGHFVLDGSLRPESDVDSLIIGSVEAMQASLVSMLNDCNSLNPDCSGNLLLKKLEEKFSMLASNDRSEELDVLAPLVYFASENPAVSPFILPPLYEYLQSDDITELREIYQGGVNEFLDDGDDTTERAIMCADDSTRPTTSDLKKRLSDYNLLSDIFAEIYISQTGMCSGWPLSLNPLPAITTNQAPPALVIGGTTDTLTLARWSEEMAQSIGGYYLESNHIGHTIAFTGQSSCVDAIAEEFLLTGLQPLASRCMSE